MEKTLLNELTQGKELAKQLRNHLNPSSSLETRQFLVQKILNSYEKALSMLNWGGFVGGTKSNLGILESPPPSSTNISPRSDASDQDFKDQKDVSKKRKTQPRWTEQVRGCSGSGLEGPLDDGYSWRKYGQKDILGANFPRSYYRCTHRHSQGCLATKQVQKSDQDPTIFEVTYRGRHTCMQVSHLAMASSSSSSLKHDMSTQNKDLFQQQQQKKKKRTEDEPNASKELLITFGEGLKVKTEDLDIRESIFPSFSFPCASIGNDNVGDDFFTESMMENSFLGSLSPTFISPATSESNYFSLTPCEMSNFGLGHGVQTPESGLTEIISATTSAANSPIGDLEISFDKVDFDSNFPYDSSELLA